MSFKVLNSFGVGESYQYFTNVGPGTGRTYSSVHALWVIMSIVTEVEVAAASAPPAPAAARMLTASSR